MIQPYQATHLLVERNELLIHVTPSMGLKSIMLSEKRRPSPSYNSEGLCLLGVSMLIHLLELNVICYLVTEDRSKRQGEGKGSWLISPLSSRQF